MRVAIDLSALAGGVDVSRISVRELAAGSREDLGPADSFEIAEGGRKLLLRVGKPGVGRYVINWK